MKKILTLLHLILISNFLFAQWTTSGTNIYNSNTGNVGIGVISPAAKLEIVNAGSASLRVGVVGNRANTHAQIANSLAVLGDNNSSVASTVAGAWNFYNNGSSPSYAGTLIQHFGTAMAGNQYGAPAGNQGTLLFQNVSNGVIASNGSNLHISPGGVVSTSFLTNGSVGIGTSTPGTFKLAVEGKIGAREIKVLLTTPWPDYVFHHQYKLLPLSDLEKFIQTNKHLPNIPSAQEVKDNEGIDLGDMNTKLLEKIEELTLYMIELKKDNEQIREEMKKVLSRVDEK